MSGLAGGLPPPSTRVGRRVAEPEPLSPLRAVAGAGVAVAGVALGIGALLTLSEEPERSGPVVAVPSLTSLAGPTAAPPSSVVPTAALPSSAVPTAAPVSPRPPATTPAPAMTPTPAPEVIPVTVLNNSRITGLAARSAERFATAGWPIRQVGNFTGRIRATTIYYLPGQLSVARRFATAFDVPRVLPRFAGLPGSGFTVVLTRDYA